jgi:hypothetical protein
MQTGPLIANVGGIINYWPTGDTPMNPQIVPLALLADAWATTTEALTHELGDKILTDDLEIPHVTVDDARALLTTHKAAQARQRQADEQRRATMDAMNAPIRARVAAIQAQQRQMRQDGQIDNDTPAYVAMTAGGNDANNAALSAPIVAPMTAQARSR